MNDKTRFTAKGVVLGNLWGGGTGAYSATHLEAPTKDSLIKIAKKALADKTLDSGMGFESLKGAVLFITKTTSKFIQGKEFINKEHEFVTIGKLTEDEIDFLNECEI